jgi:hypothetical protein
VANWPEQELLTRRYDRVRAQGVFHAT